MLWVKALKQVFCLFPGSLLDHAYLFDDGWKHIYKDKFPKPPFALYSMKKVGLDIQVSDG